MAAGRDRRVGAPAVEGPDDRELAARLMAGDTTALVEVNRRFAPLVFGMCRRVLNDDGLAEDVAQEVFLYLWQSPDRFDASRGSLRSWLALLAHRRSVDRVRSETRRARAEHRCEPSLPLSGEADDFLTVNWMGAKVRDALDRLPAEQRQAVVLAYYGDRSYRQVAAELDIPEGTAKSRLRLALGKLNELLSADYADQGAQAWT